VAELQPTPDGRWHFSLGVVEKWVVGVSATLLIGGVSYAGMSLDHRLESLADGNAELSNAIQEMTTKQAVANSQLLTMNAQLADVPAIKLELARHAIQIEQNKQDVQELRQIRGLK